MRPPWKFIQILVGSDLLEDKQYPAFPTTLRANNSEILDFFKKSYNPTYEKKSVWQLIRFNPITTEVSKTVRISENKGLYRENGDWMNYG